MIKNIVFSLLMTVVALGGFAQTTMQQVWKDMPDSISGYLNKEKRGLMIEFYHVEVLGNVSNSLGGTSTIHFIDDRYCSVSMSNSMWMDMMLLPKSEGDTILCVVKTYKGPEPESVVDFYTLDWQKNERTELLPELRFDQLVERPDSMAVDDFERLCSYFDPQLIGAVLSPEDCSLSFSLSMPMLSETEKKELRAILVRN